MKEKLKRITKSEINKIEGIDIIENIYGKLVAVKKDWCGCVIEVCYEEHQAIKEKYKDYEIIDEDTLN